MEPSKASKHRRVLASLSALLAIYVVGAATGLFAITPELYPGYPNLLGILFQHKDLGLGEIALTILFATYATVSVMLMIDATHAHKLAFLGFLSVVPYWPVGTLMAAYYFWFWIYKD